MPKEKIPEIINRITVRLMTYAIGTLVMKDIPSEEKSFIFRQKIELMTYRPDFNKLVVELRKRSSISIKGFKNVGECNEWAEKLPAIEEVIYEDDIDDLLKHFDIKKRWYNIIEYYILFNNIDAPHLFPKSVFVELIPNLNNEIDVCIKIQAETTLRDIKNWWPVIKTWQGIAVGNKKVLDKLDPITEYPKAFKNLPKGDEDIKKQLSKKDKKLTAIYKYKEAYDLKMKGKIYKEIKDIMNAEESRKEAFSVEDIRDFIRQFKNAIENNELD